MLKISQKQYDKILPIAKRLKGNKDYVSAKRLIECLDKESPDVYTLSKEEIIYEYKLALVSAFFREWEHREAIKFLGVVQRQSKIATRYYTLESACTNQEVSKSAKQQVETALTLLRTYAPYCKTWNESPEELLHRVIVIFEEIDSKCLVDTKGK